MITVPADGMDSCIKSFIRSSLFLVDNIMADELQESESVTQELAGEEKEQGILQLLAAFFFFFLFSFSHDCFVPGSATSELSVQKNH
ncbi:hypothetical protein VTN31DRAFT_1861 [Thermomyces dupontii]|uniref:uncharacterized protein n=1 Tax=Talaromyces thermophilus TaxID=28565 RepID=UPI0037435C63